LRFSHIDVKEKPVLQDDSMDQSIFRIAVDRMHDAKWLFPQEKATLYELKKVYVYSKNALVIGHRQT
jgi:hypothetical protein